MTTTADALAGRPGGNPPVGSPMGESWSEWFDRHSRTIFIAPAIFMILVFAIFPTIASLVIAVS
ncbi:MAG: hypothetical protein ACOVOI_20435, partial [Hyphomicrobiales bacterium]